MLAGCPGLGLPGTSSFTEEDAESFEADPVAAQQSVDDGKTSLEGGDYEAALDSFSEALQHDPSNGEALVYYSTLSLARIATDPDLATIAGDYFGIKGYPTTINEFLDFSTWLTGTITVTDDETGQTVTTVELIDVLYPDIEIPESIATYEDSIDSITQREYALGLAYNFVTRNPNGVNALTDAVVEDVLGDQLNSVVQTIEDIPDDVMVTLGWELFYMDAQSAIDDGWPTETVAGETPAEITFGKAELLLETAFLRNIRSQLFMTQAYSKALPLQNWWNEVNPADNSQVWENGQDLPWGDLITPFAAGFLFPREGATGYLNKAKGSFLAAVQNLKSALESILAGRDDMTLDGSSDLYFNPAGSTEVQTVSWENDVAPYLGFQLVSVGRIENSLLTGNLVAFPADNYNFESQKAFLEYYADEANWPNEAGVEEEDFNGTTLRVPAAYAINYSVPYETPIGAINFLLDMNDETGEPNFYEFSFAMNSMDELTYVENENPGTSVSQIPSPYTDSNTFYALRIPDITLAGLYDIEPFLGEIRNSIDTLNSDELMVATPDGTTLSEQLIVENPDGTISAYIPAIPPFLANETFTEAGQTVTLDYAYWDATSQWTTTGSFWWGLGNLSTLSTTEETVQ